MCNATSDKGDKEGWEAGHGLDLWQARTVSAAGKRLILSDTVWFWQARKDTTKLSFLMSVAHTPGTIHTTLDNQLRNSFLKGKKRSLLKHHLHHHINPGPTTSSGRLSPISDRPLQLHSATIGGKKQG